MQDLMAMAIQRFRGTLLTIGHSQTRNGNVSNNNKAGRRSLSVERQVNQLRLQNILEKPNDAFRNSMISD